MEHETSKSDDAGHQSGRAVLSHIGWSALRSWGERFTTLALFIILTRLLSPDQVGALAYLMALNSLILVVAEGALSEWLIRSADSTREQEVTIFTVQGLFGTVLAAGLCAVGIWFGPAMIGRSDAAVIIAVLSLTIPVGVMAKVPEALLQRRFAFKQMAFRSFAVMWSGGLIGIGCALGGLGIWSLVIKQLWESTGYLLITLYAAHWRPGIAFEFSKIKEAIRYAVAVFGSWIFEAVSQRADSLIVGSVLGTVALGYYSIALRIFQVMTELFTAVISRVSMSHFAPLARKGTEELSQFYRKMLDQTTRFFVPLIAIFASLAWLTVPLVFGQKWASAAMPLEALCFIPLCTTVTCFTYPIMLATGRPQNAMQVNVVAALCTIAGAAAGCAFGLTGVAVGVASRMLIVLPLSVFFVAQVTTVSLRQHAAVLLPGLIEGAAGMAAALALAWAGAGLPAPLRLAAAIAAGLAASYATLWLLLAATERRKLLQLLRSFI